MNTSIVEERLDVTFRYRGKRTPIPYRPGNASFAAFYRELLQENGIDGLPKEEGAQKNGFIYFARMGDHVKIGFSINWRKRIAQLQTSAPGRVEVIRVINGTLELESKIHERFSDLRASGEWFRATDYLLSEIDGL